MKPPPTSRRRVRALGMDCAIDSIPASLERLWCSRRNSIPYDPRRSSGTGLTSRWQIPLGQARRCSILAADPGGTSCTQLAFEKVIRNFPNGPSSRPGSLAWRTPPEGRNDLGVSGVVAGQPGARPRIAGAGITQRRPAEGSRRSEQARPPRHGSSIKARHGPARETLPVVRDGESKDSGSAGNSD